MCGCSCVCSQAKGRQREGLVFGESYTVYLMSHSRRDFSSKPPYTHTKKVDPTNHENQTCGAQPTIQCCGTLQIPFRCASLTKFNPAVGGRTHGISPPSASPQLVTWIGGLVVKEWFHISTKARGSNPNRTHQSKHN